MRGMSRQGPNQETRIAGNALKGPGRQRGQILWFCRSVLAEPRPRGLLRGGWIATPSDLTTFFVHSDGFKDTDQLLSDEALRTMTTTTAANPRYAKGLFVDSRNNWWHTDLLDGTNAVSLRTSGDFCWSAFTNASSRDRDASRPLGHLLWEMVRSVADWHPERRA
jgi:hypothetical protein